MVLLKAVLYFKNKQNINISKLYLGLILLITKDMTVR